MSEFTAEGFNTFPNTFEDNKIVRNFSDKLSFPDEVLARKESEYSRFLQRTDLMPRAQEIGERILNHIVFEIDYRVTEEEGDGAIAV